jgi:hypothetical protein
MNMTSWLVTDEIQILFALFMCNQKIEKPYFHVMHPNVTQIIASLYPNMVKVNGHTATKKEQDQYNKDLNKLKDYIDTRLDIFEPKFLVFVCNVNSTHWLSVVAINRFLVYDKFLQDDGKHDVSNEEMAGWCVLNSNPHSNEKQINGFQGTCFTRNNASYGVWLFLNVCAWYLKAKEKNEKDGTHPNQFDYKEPFGRYTESVGTTECAWFDFGTRSIVAQSTSNDCGLASVANSMAFLKHLEKVDFTRSNMETAEQSIQPNEVCFLLKEYPLSLMPFWNSVS